MQLQPRALVTHLAKTLAPIYTIYGDEHLLVQETVDQLRAAARAAGYTDREVLLVDRGFDWRNLFHAKQSMSLFGNRKLVELRVPAGKPGRDGGSALVAHAKNVKLDVLTIVTLPRLDAAATKSDWFSALNQAGITIKIEPVDRENLADWIEKRLMAQGQRVPAGDDGRRVLQFIVDQIEGNLLAAHQEIQKLGLIYPKGELTFTSVQDAVLNVARYDVFKLKEVVLAGDIQRLTRMLEGLRGQGEAVQLVLWALTEEVRTLSRIFYRMSEGMPLTTLLREYRVWGPRELWIRQAVQRVTPVSLHNALFLATLLDRQVKGLTVEGLASDPWDGLLELGLILLTGKKLSDEIIIG
ncbi:DNA polymerase III subunit delta [Candidatus Pandoraea novymonadis]|uniref:DNA polymerase III subunit delta n=1 Tax=Candidatus Pandoraea novymonadis TaxID=1808959 RepID=A0ABX5FDB0_9BURK|nr:DNA polymerase III subunit delta [Candidatus Pandoraea novymonadis]PSB91706.1 DNA polymerase III subunit delta [Candidatus Pandoraea novymonadis]